MSSAHDRSYFEYLRSFAEGRDVPYEIGYSKLLQHMHDTEFYPVMPEDANRCEDGKALRWQFDYELGDGLHIADDRDTPCSILELIISVAQKIELYMGNPVYGDRTRYWITDMVRSLGLLQNSNSRYDPNEVSNILDRFVNRCYAPNGAGGLFTLGNTIEDIRKVPIWEQMNLYFDQIKY